MIAGFAAFCPHWAYLEINALEHHHFFADSSTGINLCSCQFLMRYK